LRSANELRQMRDALEATAAAAADGGTDATSSSGGDATGHVVDCHRHVSFAKAWAAFTAAAAAGAAAAQPSSPPIQARRTLLVLPPAGAGAGAEEPLRVRGGSQSRTEIGYHEPEPPPLLELPVYTAAHDSSTSAGAGGVARSSLSACCVQLLLAPPPSVVRHLGAHAGRRCGGRVRP
jgi:hypothetical protein